MPIHDKILTLNVGGVYFWTRTSTLTGQPSFFAGLVAMMESVEEDETFIDRDPLHFRYVLNWMRGSKVLPHDPQTLKELEVEADYYALTDMVDAIRRMPRHASVDHQLKNIADEIRRCKP